MTIRRLKIDGKVYRNQDFRDLVDALNNPNTNHIKALYFDPIKGGISSTQYQEFIRNNQGVWFQTKDFTTTTTTFDVNKRVIDAGFDSKLRTHFIQF